MNMNTGFKQRQLLLLFLSSVTILFVGMGLFPQLPLYAAQFGATRTTIGLAYALMYASYTAGPLLIGWLVGRLAGRQAFKLHPRVLFVAAGLLGVPALALLGQATTLWQVIALTSLVWFCGGVDGALISIYTGRYASGKSRGKSFSLMSLAAPIGALTGSAAIGQLVTWKGYAGMFASLAGVWGLLPLIGILGFKDPDADFPGHAQATPGTKGESGRFPGMFAHLLAATLLSATTISVGRLGTSLSMQALEFSAQAIASSTMVSGLIAIPAALLIGALSDQLGRRRLLALTYLMAVGGGFILISADQVWHFWLAASLTLVAFCANGALASALATDLLDPGLSGRGLSWVNAATSVTAILSFGGTGYMMDTLGPATLYTLAASLPAVALLLLRGAIPAEPSAPTLQGTRLQEMEAKPCPDGG